MNVDSSLLEPVATRVWFEFRSSLLSVEINGIVTSIDFRLIAEEDFESSTAVVKFEIGCKGTIIVCHHRDGAETWLPVDMWLPGGFTSFTNGVVLRPQAV
jgi:hypothetical protein